MLGKKKIKFFNLKKFFGQNYWIIILFVVALLVRVYGIDPGYPQIHPDEGTSYHTAIYLLYHWFKPDRFDYPAGMPLINSILYSVFFIPVMVVKILLADYQKIFELIFHPFTFFKANSELIFGHREIYAMYWSRYISAFFGSLAVLMVYVNATKLFKNKSIGLLAAFFLAFNFRHVLGSHFGLPDSMGSFFNMLTLYFCILLFEKDTRRRYLLVGIAAGLTFSLKYQVFIFVPVVVAHCLLAIKKRSLWYIFNKNFVFSMLSALLVFLIINPYYLPNFGSAMYQNSIDFRRYQVGVVRLRLYPIFYLFHWGIGKLPFVSILIGIFFMPFKNFQRFILLFSFPAAYLYFMTAYSSGGIYSRNFIQVIPFLMIFAGYFVYEALLSLKKNFDRKIALLLITILILFINFEPIKNSLTLDYWYSKPWTQTILAEWLSNKIPNDSKIREYPLFLDPYTVAKLHDKGVNRLSWSYDKGPNDLAEFQAENDNFAIINAYNFQSIIYYWRDSFNPLMYFKMDDIPFDFIDNSFYGASVKELINYTVFETYKPWQAQETSNMLVFKIPDKPKNIGTKIKNFTFDKEDDIWKLRSSYGFDSLSLRLNDSEGKNNKGSIELTKEAGLLVSSRFGSKPIPIKSGKLYTVRGWIKNSTPRWTHYLDRDGFIRMDFYKDVKELDKAGIKLALSDRAPVTTDGSWNMVSASMVAPKDSNYMTVSFQLTEGNYYSLYLDDVEVYESDDNLNEQNKQIPYIKSTIPRNSLYFNSFL